MTPVVQRPGKPGTAWTVAEACEWYKRATEALGRPPTYEEARPYHAAFDRLFGSWPAFMRANGDSPRGKGQGFHVGDGEDG